MTAKKTLAQSESLALKIQGAAVALFGVAAVGWPGLTLEVLIYLFAAFLLVDGLVLLAMGLRRHHRDRRTKLMLLLGALQLAAGAFLLWRPDIGLSTFILILGLALIARGAFEIVQLFFRKRTAKHRVLHGLLGVTGVTMGLVVLMLPVGGGLAIVWALGLYALVAGPVMVGMSIDLVRSAGQ